MSQFQVSYEVIVGGINDVHFTVVADEVFGEAERPLYFVVALVEGVDGSDCRYAAIGVIHL